MTAPEHLAPVWNLLAAGAERTGHVTVGDHDTSICIAQNALAALHNAGYEVVPGPSVAGTEGEAAPATGPAGPGR